MKSSKYMDIRENLQKAIDDLSWASADMSEGDAAWLELSDRVEDIITVLYEIQREVREVPLVGSGSCLLAKDGL